MEVYEIAPCAGTGTTLQLTDCAAAIEQHANALFAQLQPVVKRHVELFERVVFEDDSCY
ncbi:MAG: hypothetical protein HC848_00770 [Limnobacter sp.]|nr:hypothetical protein [Limnobacter sp.]